MHLTWIVGLENVDIWSSKEKVAWLGKPRQELVKYILQIEGEKGDFPPNFHPSSVTF